MLYEVVNASDILGNWDMIEVVNPLAVWSFKSDIIVFILSDLKSPLVGWTNLLRHSNATFDV